jgi:protein-tyrosine phosphatase
MIDIHTHLLPFVDDGVNDYNEAIEILIDLQHQGVEHLFVTPHYYRLRNYLSTYQENLVIFNQLKEMVEDKNLSIKLYLANEIKFSKDIFKEIESGLVHPLKDQMYLIEFSVKSSAYEISEAVFNMVVKGYTPIIAHVERYLQLSKDDVFELKRLGALVQVNASSLLGKHGGKEKRYVKTLINQDLVDFIASDSHQLNANLMLDGYRYVEKKFSKDKADQLFNNIKVL